MSSQTQPTQQPKQITPVDRRAMEQIHRNLGKGQKLPRLQPPELMKSRACRGAGILYTVDQKDGIAVPVNHAELTVLHEIAEETKKAVTTATAANTSALN